MNISYELIKPFEPFGMPHSDSIKNSLLLKEIKVSIELIFGGSCAAWRLDKIYNIEKDEKKLIDEAESWMRLSLEQLGAKTVLPKLRQLYDHKGVNIGFSMMVNYRLPNNSLHGEYIEYIHGREPNRASTLNKLRIPSNKWPY